METTKTIKRKKRLSDDDVKSQINEALVDAAMAEQLGDEQQQLLSECRANQLLQMSDQEWRSKIEFEHRFYEVKIKKGEPVIEFLLMQTISVLKWLGFFRYDDESNNGQTLFVQIRDGKIRQIYDTKNIRDAFEDYVKRLTDRDIEIDGMKVHITPAMLCAKLYTVMGYLLGDDKLERLRPDEQITIMHDTYHYKYFYFRNYVVQVGADGITEIPYKQLSKHMEAVEKATGEANGKYIWENNIINRDYNSKASRYGDFERFCQYICGYEVIEKGLKDDEESKKNFLTYSMRLKSLRSILGYLMHGNFECNVKAVLFMDANINGEDRREGGTGKGVLGIALSNILNRTENDCKYISEPGKSFSIDNERRYSNGDISTQLIHIEDIKDKFKFDEFYNDVTDKLPIRKMNKDRVMIRSKIMLSSNIPIDVVTTGNSTARRLVVFELDNYFNKHRTPVDIFGHLFFKSQWTKNDWQEFDRFMVESSLIYMENKDKKGDDGKIIGIIEPPQINYRHQLLYTKLSEDFIVWFGEKIKISCEKQQHTEYRKDLLYTQYCEKYTEYKNEQLYKRAFTNWCKFYLQVMNIPFIEKRSTYDLFILYPNKNVVQQQLTF